MRRSIVIAVCAWCAGFLAANATALAYTKLNAWRGYGETFQLGYVVGFMDAVALWKRKDSRGMTMPVEGRPNFEEIRGKVNAFFADPANQKHSIPDAMSVVGGEMTLERLKQWHDREARTPNGAPSPGVSAGAQLGSQPSPPTARRKSADGDSARGR